MSEIPFGECAQCFNQLERPFWDTICFDCQDDRSETDLDEPYMDDPNGWERTPAA